MATQQNDSGQRVGAAIRRVLQDNDTRPEAVDELWYAMNDEMYRAAKKCCPQNSDNIVFVEDVIQNSLIECLRLMRDEPDTLLQVRSWHAWANIIAKNELFDLLKREKRYYEKSKERSGDPTSADSSQPPEAKPDAAPADECAPAPTAETGKLKYVHISLDHPSELSDGDGPPLHERLVTPDDGLLEDRIVQRDLWRRIYQVLDAIDNAQRRKAFRLYLDGWQCREIASVCAVSEATVNNWIHRVRAKIVSALSETPAGRGAK